MFDNPVEPVHAFAGSGIIEYNLAVDDASALPDQDHPLREVRRPLDDKVVLVGILKRIARGNI